MKTLPSKREDISPSVRGTDIEYVQAYYGTGLSNFSMDDAIKKIIQILNKAFFELSKSPGGSTKEERKKQMTIMAKLIWNDSRLYYPNITMEEIELAITRGIRNVYGEFYGLNVISVHNFIEAFILSEERQAALERQRRFVESLKPAPEPTEAEKEKMVADGFELRRKEYSETKRICDYGNVNYDYAVAKGLINLTADEKWELYYQAEKRVKVEMLQEATTLHQIIAWQCEEHEAEHLRVVRKAKDLALKQYFDKIGPEK